jgi:G-protein signaling modulator 2
MEISHNYYHSNGDYNDKYLNHEDDVVLPELSPDRPSCQDLAIEGERLSKQGDYAEAIPVLEAAIETGTCDMQLLSVLWSLLGNAHFYQGDYETAIKCHSHDLAICCETNDEKSKAQAYCNLGISQRKSGFLKKAKLCYESYLELCEQLEDRRSISKANHNLGDLHLTLGKLKIQRDGGMENSPEGRDDLASASMYIEKHLEFVQDHGSRLVRD